MAGRPIAYDGRWGVHSYTTDQLPAQAFCRQLVVDLAAAVTAEMESRNPDPVWASIKHRVFLTERGEIQNQHKQTQMQLDAERLYVAKAARC
jgi:hypothetical protein